MHLYREGLLTAPGRSLDLGFGDGSDVIAMAKCGLVVDAVESDREKALALRSLLGDRDDRVSIFETSIEDFHIEPGRYVLIVSNNVLPFLGSHVDAAQMIQKIIEGLAPCGCAYFTVFGNRDEWSSRSSAMNFWTYDDLIRLLKSFQRGYVYYSTIEEGYAKTMKGDIKYWNVFRITFINDSQHRSLPKAA